MIWFSGAGALLAAALVVTGCKSEPRGPSWEERVLEVQRLQERGEYDRAETKYRTLLEEAGDASDRRYAQLQLARLAVDRERYDEALERYRAVWTDAESGSTPARAMFEASELLSDHLDAPERARTLRVRILETYPETTWAERAVASIAEDYRRREDWRGLRDRFEALYETTRETSLAEDILYELARTLHRDAGETDAALDFYRRLLENHPDGDLVDDAEWEAAQIYVERQNWNRAIELLESLAEKVEASAWVGTYNSPHASKAQYRLGFIHLTHLDDYREALEHFRTYLDDFPDNRRADDALWHMAQAHRLLGEREEMKRTLRRLVEEYPKSRYARRARDELGEGAEP